MVLAVVRCFNCEHLIVKFFGAPKSEQLFTTETHACKVKDLVLPYYEMTKERDCDRFQESKGWVKYEHLFDD